MRRYAQVSVLLLFVAAFLAAWVNAQETKRATPKIKFKTETKSQHATLSAPQPFSGGADASPIAGEERGESNIAVTQATGEPVDAVPQVARRQILGSRLGPTVMSAPVHEPNVTSDVEIVADSGDYAPAAAPNIPSVLKKKAGTRPSVTQRSEARLTPTTIVDESVETDGSSRRSPTTQPQSINSNQPKPVKTREMATKVAPNPVPAPTAAPDPKLIEVSGAAPQLVVEAVGPQAVTVGKPAAYQVRLKNVSDAMAEEVAVRISLPAWVQVHGGAGSRGEAKQEHDAAGRQWLVWSIPQLSGGATEQLALELVVQQNQPFELAMQWSARPASLVAEITVREPQIEVRLEGPSDMLFGEQKTFMLHLNNPGTGDAENVAIEVSSGGGQTNRLEVGTLAAGEQKQIPFSVAATAPGEMEIKASATGAGLATEAASRVLVHKAELQVAIDVPPLKFAGAESTYQVAVANIGDAVAEQVTLSVALPQGAKYVAGLDGAAKVGEGLTLKIGNLAPNAEKVFDVRCTLTQAGENHFEVAARGKGELAAIQTAVTRVETLADLKLSVVEPGSPVPVGGEGVYEVRLTNRGTKSAGSVKVVVQFAQGIEPLDVSGGVAAVANGQAIFEPLADVAAGQEVVLKVRAKGESAGSHAFRVEVKVAETDTKLVSEGVTRCFADSAAGRATARKSPLQPVPATKSR